MVLPNRATTSMMLGRLGALALGFVGAGIILAGCSHLRGERELYMDERAHFIEMDSTLLSATPVTRVASWPGPTHYFALVRSDPESSFARSDSTLTSIPGMLASVSDSHAILLLPLEELVMQAQTERDYTSALVGVELTGDSGLSAVGLDSQP